MVDMRKTILILSSLALLASGCNKVQTVDEPAKDSSRHLTVNIDVNFASETRSVKTGWETGDVIYVVFDHFFTDNLNVRPGPAYYMTLTYNGSSWTSEFSDPALETYLMDQTSGKLAAVYSSAQSPEFVYIYNTPHTQPAIYVNKIGYTGFHMSSEVDYTVAEGTLTASLQMALKDNDIYFSIAGMSGNKDRYSLKCEHFAYNIFSNFGCYSDGVSYYGPPKVTLKPSAYGILIEAAQIAYTDEYYFCGYLNPDVKGAWTDYLIQISDNMGTPDDDSDDVTYALPKRAKLNGKEAIKLPPLDNPKWIKRLPASEREGYLNGHKWVLMGDGRKWAAQNVGAATETDGGAFMTLDEAFAYSEWGEGWRLPPMEERDAPLDALNQQARRYYDNEDIFAGIRITYGNDPETFVASMLYLPASGFIDLYTNSHYAKTEGNYWSSTPVDKQDPYYQEGYYYIAQVKEGNLVNTYGDVYTGSRVPHSMCQMSVRFIVDE